MEFKGIVEERQIDALRPYSGNSRTHSRRQIRQNDKITMWRKRFFNRASDERRLAMTKSHSCCFEGHWYLNWSGAEVHADE